MENKSRLATAIKSMIPSATATLSQAALLVENRRENLASPVVFVVPVVWSFSSTKRLDDRNHSLHISKTGSHKRFGSRYICCAVNMFQPTFTDKSKVLAAEDTNIQSILFGLHLSLLSHFIELWKLSLPLTGTDATQA